MDIFCTHLHSDHTGLAPELIRPGCRIFIGGDRRARGEGGSGPGLLGGGSTGSMSWTASPGGRWRPCGGDNPAQTAAPPWREGLYTPLPDGAELRYGGHTLRCVLTPGHTPGHLCLYDPGRRRLFCGDHVLFHITPNICRWQRVRGLPGGLSEEPGPDGGPGCGGAVSRPPGGDRGICGGGRRS